VPPAAIRQLRDLTGQGSHLVADRARVANRIQKVLEDANIKLASVATDIWIFRGAAEERRRSADHAHRQKFGGAKRVLDKFPARQKHAK